MSRIVAITVVMPVVLIRVLLAQETNVDNLVLNGDFSQVQDGKPVGWGAYGGDNVTQALEVVTEQGNSYSRLSCTRFKSGGGSSHAMIAQVGHIKLEKGKMYEFSCRVRGEGIRGRNVNVAIRDTAGWHDCGLSAGVRVRKSWQKFRTVFRAARPVSKTSRLQFWYTETGTFYLDNVSIVEVSVEGIEFTDVIADVGAKNLVPNGSFEAGEGGWSSLGRGATWSANLARLHGRIERSGGVDGKAFLRVPLGGDCTPILYGDYLRPEVRRETQTLVANRHWIPVEKGAQYTLSCYMRASEEGVRAVLGVRAKDPNNWRRDQRHTVKLTTSWQRHTYTFRPSRRYVFVTVGPDLEKEKDVTVDVDAIQLENGAEATAFEPRTPVELGILPSAPSGIFTHGEANALRIRAYNHSNRTVHTHVVFEITDFFDQRVELPPVAFEVGACSAVDREVRLPAEWKGYYHVTAKYKVGAARGTSTIRVAVVPRRTTDSTVLGVNHAFGSSYLVELSKKAGLTWYRDWSIKWQDVEPSPGQYRWEVIDAQFNRIVKEGVHMMAFLPAFPSANWISEYPKGVPTTGYPGVRLREAWAPKDPKRLGEFVAVGASRYKDRVRVWEFLNEPIFTSYSLPGKGKLRQYGGKRYTPADYVDLLKIAAAGMRRGDPGCLVMGGIGGGPHTYTREVLEAGCLKYVDIFNLHIYPGSRLPESYIGEMDELLAMMDRHGGRKPIWMTEFSYYAADDLPTEPFVPNQGWAQQRFLSGERECADLTVRFFVVMLARGVEKIFIHSGRCGSVNEPADECCLYAYGGAPRKVVPALAVFTELMGSNPKYVTEKRLGEAGHCIAFETGKQCVLAAWTEFDDDLAVAVEGMTECVDCMGRTVATRPIPLSTSPTYVLGPAGKAEDLARGICLASPGRSVKTNRSRRAGGRRK